MKKIGVFIFILLIVVGCSNEDDMDKLLTNYESQIENQQKEIKNQQIEIKELTEAIEQHKKDFADYSSSLQEADRESRRIMRFISEGKFEDLKTEYNVEFEVKGDVIDFGIPEFNIPFPIELAGNLMFIASFSKFSEGTDINYFIDDPVNERLQLINISFDKDMDFEYILIGEP